MEPHTDAPDESWKELQPVLDAALDDLGAKDREALLLRFYRALSVKEVAGTLGITTAAAQKRIDRATVRLREKLSRRGCQTGGTLAGVLLAGFAADAQAAIPPCQILTAKAIAATASGGMSGTTFLTATSRKTTSVLIPAGILLAGGIWLAFQYQSISELKESNASMASRLSKENARTETAREALPIATELDREPVDWVEIARQLRASRSSPALDPYARLQERFTAMSLDEIDAALDEIATVRLSEDDGQLLEERFAEEIYIKGGPSMMLERFLPVMDKRSWRWTMGRYFSRWMDSNPDEAIPWLAKHVGQMRNISFSFFEVSFHKQLESSPETASRLLAVIPPKRRLEALRSLSNRAMPEASQIAWAYVVRKHIPKAITWPIMNWSDGDGSPMTLTQVSGYMERINATKEERVACMLEAGRGGSGGRVNGYEYDPKISEWIPEFRKWVESIEPSFVDAATGAALAGQYDISQERVKVALQYHASSGNDELLLPLLDRDQAGDESRTLARELAGHLTDATLRQKYLEKFK